MDGCIEKHRHRQPAVAAALPALLASWLAAGSV